MYNGVLHTRGAGPALHFNPSHLKPYRVSSRIVSARALSTRLSASSEDTVIDSGVRAVLIDLDALLDEYSHGERRAFVRESCHSSLEGEAESGNIETSASAIGVGHTNAETSGFAKLVQQLKSAGLKVAVASPANASQTNALLAQAGLSPGMFDAVVADDGAASSSGPSTAEFLPAEFPFIAAAARLGAVPLQCVSIHSTAQRAQAARSVGMRVITLSSAASEKGVRRLQPTAISPSLSDIAVDSIVRLPLDSLLGATSQPYCFAFSTPNRTQGDLDGSAGDAGPRGLADRSSEPGGSSSLSTQEREASEGTSASSQQGVGWLDQPVALPGGYRTTRRDALKFLSLGTALTATTILFTRAKAMSFASPKAILSALFPREDVTKATSPNEDRVPAFKRYIANLEKRGGGEVVPEFPSGCTWLNAPPLRLGQELRGRVVLLDFWTYCCINCMHVLPELAALERKYDGAPVTVVGVHSAKFDNEKDSDAIRQAVLRYEITHPVINDSEMKLWRALGVSSWPTIAVVSPEGRLLAMLAGEGHKQDLDDFIAAALEYYGEKGLLDDTPVPQALEKDKDSRLANSPLQYPGKLAVDPQNSRLFISDSNNNRVLVTNLQGNFLQAIGGNGIGLADGSFDEAAFNRPQGLAWDAKRERLYIADTENNSLRAADFRTGMVSTIAGNGGKGSDYVGGGTGGNQQLNSPWDLALAASGDELFIAMAGQHQIWKCDLQSGACFAFSGNGYERNQNSFNGLNTSWAQPSGLSLSADGTLLYVADSESSSLRVMQTATGGSRLLAGGDALLAENLFLFGDRDGPANRALLQHPLATAVAPDGSVYIADSYNHRIKRYDPVTGTVSSVAGRGVAGFKDGSTGESAVSEPGGLVFAPDGSLLVADTNNCVIRRLDVASGRLTTLALANVPPPRSLERREGSVDSLPAGVKLVVAEPVTGTSGSINLFLRLPSGYHFTKGASSTYVTTQVTGPAGVLSFSSRSGALVEAEAAPAASVAFERVRDESAEARVRILARVYFCRDEDVCLLEEVAMEVPITLSGGPLSSAVSVTHTVQTSAQKVAFPAV